MDNIINWIYNNKEWLFSGVAGTIISGYLLTKYNKNNESEGSDKQNQINTQTQNLTINVGDKSQGVNSTIDTQPSAKTLTIDGIRAQTNILFIDDDKEFKIVPILKKAGWKNTSFHPNADVIDINSEKIQKSHIIFVDIKGVGKTMYEDEGLGLVVDLKKKYPQKKVVIYSADPEHKIFHEALNLADDKVQKNSQPAVFVSAIETLAEEIWKNV